VGGSIDNGITIGFLVGDLKSALDELKSKGVKIFRDIIEREPGKNAQISARPVTIKISLMALLFLFKILTTISTLPGLTVTRHNARIIIYYY